VAGNALAVAANIKGSGLLRVMVPLMTGFAHVSTRHLLRDIDRGIV
jgi:hypothetical protein